MVILQPVLSGNAKATDIPTGAATTLSLTDPDSMTIDPRGNIVLDSQADCLLVSHGVAYEYQFGVWLAH